MIKLKYLLGLVLVLSILACNSSKPISLQLNLPKGDNFIYRMSTTNDVNIKVMGQNQQNLSSQVFDMQYDVKNRKANGDMEIETTIKDVMISQTSAMGVSTYDSKNPSKNTPASQAAMYEAILGYKYSIIQNNKGQLISMSGSDELIDKMIKNSPDMSAMGIDKEQVKETYSMQFGDEAMKKMLSNLQNIYPANPVKKGDTWSKKDTLDGTIGMIVHTTYKLTDRKANKSYIDVSGVISPNPDSEGMNMMGMKMVYKLSGTSTGKIVVDEITGWADQSNIIQDLKGTVDMSGELIGSMSTDMEMHTESVAEKLN